jgi:hypothetical protein
MLLPSLFPDTFEKVAAFFRQTHLIPVGASGPEHLFRTHAATGPVLNETGMKTFPGIEGQKGLLTCRHR